MSKVLFFGMPAYGHTNPSLGFVRELVARGEKVIYYSFPEFKEKVLSTGAEYRESPGAERGIDAAFTSSRLSYLYRAIVEAASREIEPSIEIIRAENPDYVIHDSLAAWGKFAAVATNTPSVASITTFLYRSHSINLQNVFSIIPKIRPVDVKAFHKAAKSVRSLRKKYGIKETGLLDILVNTSPLNIIYTIKELQPRGDSFDPAQFKFVGPSISSRSSDVGESDYSILKKPLVYISFGTVMHEQAAFYKKSFAALGGFEGTIVMSVGNTIDVDAMGTIPGNFVVRSRVNQMEVLRNADVFVTHGGMNSAHEGLYCGVPLVFVPFQEEQRTVARQCAAMGCGLYLNKLDAGKVARAIAHILKEPAFREKSRTLSKLLHKSSGVKAAVDAIFEYKKIEGIG
jgi:MGT family glycosyltransferase